MDPDRARALRLARQLRAAGDHRVTIAQSSDCGVMLDRQSPGGFDVAVVALEIGPRGGIDGARQFAELNPTAEVVFFGSDRRSVDFQAAHCLGIRRVIPADELPRWLMKAAPLLGRAAEARRTLRDSLAALPPCPSFETGRDVHEHDAAEAAPLPLYDAERRFREAYLARVLSQTETRGAAARRAGVPYRTLSQMIAKLGLSGEKAARRKIERMSTVKPSDPGAE